MNSDFIRIGPAMRQGGSRKKVAALGSALLVAGSLFGWTASGFGNEDAAAVTPAPVVERMADGTAASYAEVVDRVAPAVVTIRSERMVRLTRQSVPDNPFFRDFFGDRFPQGQSPERREGGMGSGVIVRQDGYIPVSYTHLTLPTTERV